MTFDRGTRLSVSICWFLFLAWLYTVPCHATLPPRNPIDPNVATTFWTVELEEVVTIPNSSGNPPRLESLVGDGVSNLAYVIDQRGKIFAFDPGVNSPPLTEFLDLSSAVPGFRYSGQQGVRGLAFHPDFGNSGTDGYRKFYTSHTRNFNSTPIGGPRIFATTGFTNNYSVVAEWSVDPNGNVNTGSYRELLRVAQPLADHNIGQISFNPNADPNDADFGNLYVAMGDGGNTSVVNSKTDFYEHGQGTDELFGALLRIDPLANGSDPYSIPSDNALRVSSDTTNPVNLLYAYGLRNPHHFAFDTAGDEKLLITDIGQGNIEEVNLVFNGANFGWGLSEGTFTDTRTQFSGVTNLLETLPSNHTSDSITYPVAQYDHDNTSIGVGVVPPPGTSAIAGGVVYRGTAIPELTGMYIFGDFSNNPGPMFAVDVDELVQREDFTDLSSLDGGHLAPFQELRLTDGGVEKSMLQIIRDASGNQALTRTDIRLDIGPDGEFYVLNKRDGRVRRFVSVANLLEGDANRDGTVDGSDFLRWQRGAGKSGDWSNGDFDGNAFVDGTDLALWELNYGNSSLSANATTVPEPSSLGVLFGFVLLTLAPTCRMPRAVSGLTY